MRESSLYRSLRAWCVLGAACMFSRAAIAQGEPPPGTRAGLLELLSTPGAVSFGEGWAIPLIGARPAWFTAALERRVLEAAGTPVAAPSDAPLPAEVGIRPGAWMVSPHGCTMNFIFRRNGELLIGTAGHCVDQLGQEVVILTLGPDSDQPLLIDIGTVIARHDNGIGDDFALVAIRPELWGWVSATTAVIGGPCGQYDGSGPEAVVHYGHGTGIGTGGTPRGGVSLAWETDHFGWASPAIFGDSGSPVLVSGQGAAGDLTHVVVDLTWVPSFVAGTRIQKMLRIIDGLGLESSPLCGPLLEDEHFVRGESNGDRKLDLSDAVHILIHLFGKELVLDCPDASDADDSGEIDVTDAIRVLGFLFLGSRAPEPPFPDAGPDPTPDALGYCR